MKYSNTITAVINTLLPSACGAPYYESTTINNKAKPVESRRRNAMGHGFLRDAVNNATKNPKDRRTSIYRRSEMTSRNPVNNFIIYLVLIAFTAGCTTMRPLPTTSGQSLSSQIEVGDKITIIRNDLTEVTFKVADVSEEGLSGDGLFVAFSDIQQVQVRQFSTGKTVGLVAAIVGVLALGSGVDAGGGPLSPY